VQSEAEQIRARLDELERERERAYWRNTRGAHSQVRPLPRSFFEERARLQKRLRELTK
jgi:hypothetical protein